MRVANILVLGAAAVLVWACASTNLSPTQPAATDLNGNDCAVIAAIAKEHYKF